MNPLKLQRAVVLMHFDRQLADAVLGGSRPLPAWLPPEEAAMLRRTDPRAFRTDPERPLRLLAALLEEYPVSCAITGADALPGFVSSTVFHGAVMRGRLLADAFGDWLLPRAGGPAQLEQAIALARRRRKRRGAGIARAPAVELTRAPAGTLSFYAEARQALGGAPHEAVARGARLPAPAESGGLEELLVEGHADAGPGVAPCAAGLFSLLSFAREGRSQESLIEEAARLGASDDAEEVIAGLLQDGLLAHIVP